MYYRAFWRTDLSYCGAADMTGCVLSGAKYTFYTKYTALLYYIPFFSKNQDVMPKEQDEGQNVQFYQLFFAFFVEKATFPPKPHTLLKKALDEALCYVVK